MDALLFTDKAKRTQHGNMLTAINPSLFFYLYGLVSLQMDREWREYQHSWKALNFLSSSSVGILECNLYVYAFVHIRVFAFLSPSGDLGISLV